jgi:hypothetical protein
MSANEIIALAGLVLTGAGGFVVVIMRFGKVEAVAEAALAAAEGAEIKADTADKELSEFKERVAREYATSAMVVAVEGRVVAAIDRLGDRIDRILESRPVTPARRPSAK